jgi:hypothetical protein
MQELFKIVLTAYRADEGEEDRLVRLKQWVSWFHWWRNLGPIHGLYTCVESLHDHKGELTVTFCNKPTEQEIIWAKSAWEECGELGENVVIQYYETVKQLVKVEDTDG